MYESEVPDLEIECDGYEVKERKTCNLRVRNSHLRTILSGKTAEKHSYVNYPREYSSRIYDPSIERKKNSHSLEKLYHLFNFVIVILLLLIACSKLKTVSQKSEAAENIRYALQQARKRYHDAKLELQKIHDDLEYLSAKVRYTRKYDSEVNYAIGEMEHREEAINSITGVYIKQNDKIDHLKKHIQDHNRAELMRRFGPGPYFVEFEVLVRGKRHFFTLKTAPTDDMPHSVFTFMDMVHRRVWDKTVIIHHWQHITQAAPISSDGENKRGILKGELSFPEHGDFYRHEKYTVGFAGRPGGPEWYINLADNYESHGPGRQDHSKVLNDADPCFAEVVRGRDVIDLMRKISIEAMRNKGNGGLEFSSIETARIIVLKNDGNATE